MKRAMMLLMSFVFVASACGTTDDPTLSTPATTSTPTPTATPVETVGEPRTDRYATEGFPTAGGEVAYLVDVELATHERFDRLTFEFADHTPEGFQIEYVEPPVRQDGSGNEVEIEGEAFLVIVMTPASGVDLSGEDFEETYTGPDRLALEGGVVVNEAVNTGDFEAVLSWAVGLRSEVPYSFDTLEDPPRLVVDLHAPAATPRD